MRPVKVGIVHQKHQGENGIEIEFAVGINITVKCCVFGNEGCFYEDQRYQRENADGNYGVADFTGVVTDFRKFLLNFFIGDKQAKQDVIKYECYTGNQKISAADIFPIPEICMPVVHFIFFGRAQVSDTSNHDADCNRRESV